MYLLHKKKRFLYKRDIITKRQLKPSFTAQYLSGKWEKTRLTSREHKNKNISSASQLYIATWSTIHIFKTTLKTYNVQQRIEIFTFVKSMILQTPTKNDKNAISISSCGWANTRKKKSSIGAARTNHAQCTVAVPVTSNTKSHLILIIYILLVISPKTQDKMLYICLRLDTVWSFCVVPNIYTYKCNYSPYQQNFATYVRLRFSLTNAALNIFLANVSPIRAASVVI